VAPTKGIRSAKPTHRARTLFEGKPGDPEADVAGGAGDDTDDQVAGDVAGDGPTAIRAGSLHDGPTALRHDVDGAIDQRWSLQQDEDGQHDDREQ
jgi:hypothetical protein